MCRNEEIETFTCLMTFPNSHSNLEADLCLEYNPALCEFPYTVASSLLMRRIDMLNSCLIGSSVKQQA